MNCFSGSCEAVGLPLPESNIPAKSAVCKSKTSPVQGLRRSSRNKTGISYINLSDSWSLLRASFDSFYKDVTIIPCG